MVDTFILQSVAIDIPLCFAIKFGNFPHQVLLPVHIRGKLINTITQWIYSYTFKSQLNKRDSMSKYKTYYP